MNEGAIVLVLLALRKAEHTHQLKEDGEDQLLVAICQIFASNPANWKFQWARCHLTCLLAVLHTLKDGLRIAVHPPPLNTRGLKEGFNK